MKTLCGSAMGFSSHGSGRVFQTCCGGREKTKSPPLSFRRVHRVAQTTDDLISRWRAGVPLSLTRYQGVQYLERPILQTETSVRNIESEAHLNGGMFICANPLTRAVSLYSPLADWNPCVKPVCLLRLAWREPSVTSAPGALYYLRERDSVWSIGRMESMTVFLL